MSNYFQGLSPSLLGIRPASIDFPPLSVTTKNKMASPSDTIVITDDEELPSLEPGSSRPRRAPRRDYSYREFEDMIVEAVDNETETTQSRKRKRTETKGLSALDNAFEELRKAVSHKMQRLQEKNRKLRDELRQERERHEKTQAELSQQSERRVLECRICYLQPDHWVTILCGHMVCESCAGTAPHESNRIELLPDSIRFELLLNRSIRTNSNSRPIRIRFEVRELLGPKPHWEGGK